MEMRKEDRIATNIAATARLPASPAAVTMLDVSMAGCLISTKSKLATIGATILVSLSERVEAAGEIVWTDGKNCGVKFHQPMSEKSIDWIASNTD